ncbi:MAG: valine--tRNA ligase [Cytophagales bacterium]|nr:valine--tRNA ligase [Cytophagales bacterium]
MVNWDPAGKTALSDEEVIYKEVKSKLYYVRYMLDNPSEIRNPKLETRNSKFEIRNSKSKTRNSKLETRNSKLEIRNSKPEIRNAKSDEYIIIATTRPETILGDTAICVNPKDERYKHLKGKKALVPFINRAIPVIYDEYVDMEFGTGCLKVTPAHDPNDYELGVKHKLQSIDILNDDGTLNENAERYIGEDRFAARKKIVKELDKAGQLEKVEDIVNKVGYSERTDSVVEPRLSKQWFCNMKKLAKPALENVMNDKIRLHPSKFKNMYRSWMENIRDWCISRQLWWGHRIPAWYNENGDYVVAKAKEEAIEKFKNKKLKFKIVKQDEDVLDTWFSSWLWPISVFDGFKDRNNPDMKYYYPTDDLVTAPEILFFWVARMIMAGYEYRKEMPFRNVYLTGIVRDKKGRKMSKSLGNSPEPLELIDKYGADGVRFGILVSSPAGNDLLFEEKLCEQGRNFCNKIWNAFRLVEGWKIDETIEQPGHSKVAGNWFDAKINRSISTIDDHFSKYRISDALMSTYKLIWDDFCSWYLEIVKPELNQYIDKSTSEVTINFFEKLLKILHPFMPFITEEIWHLLRERSREDCIIVADWPNAKDVEVGYTPELEGPEQAISQFEAAAEVTVSIRNLRKKHQIPNKNPLTLYVKANQYNHKTFDSMIKKLCNLSDITYIDDKIEDSYSFILKSNEYFVPLDESIDKEAEVDKLNSELAYTKSFLVSVEKKLNNQGFIKNARSEIVEREKKKKADAETNIRVLEEKLLNLVK